MKAFKVFIYKFVDRVVHILELVTMEFNDTLIS